MKQILLIFILLTSLSCGFNRVSKKIRTNDFSKVICDTIVPKKDGSYAVFILKMKAEVNDSIKIKFVDELIFSGKIDTTIKADYYGRVKVPVSFNPYKATKGSVDIEFSIL
ncbi:hypothetical protein ABN763_06185 [Spongiivirga sp. MCCC 1A20706]|uniref:hypothetical protein n=1 Tax=Spongiivirga sp. MCCC 1A20706 TaxID=3160963 RepID=UPI003977D968